MACEKTEVGSKPFDEAAAQRLRFIMLAAVTAAAMNVSQPGGCQRNLAVKGPNLLNRS